VIDQGGIDKYINRIVDNDIDKYNQHLDDYIYSCSGYCVITYILGIGDRHLENLMLDSKGRLFHIDFGYILGKDPKLYIPFKLCKEMVDPLKYKSKNSVLY